MDYNQKMVERYERKMSDDGFVAREYQNTCQICGQDIDDDYTYCESCLGELEEMEALQDAI